MYYLTQRTTAFLKKVITKTERISHRQISYKEITIESPFGGHIRGKWWGPTNVRPILSLHGWQDNCATFDRLMPLLNKDVGFLAVDFPGHGYSSRLPPGMYYHFMNYIILVHYLKNYFQWPKISLMGHSLGGVTSYVYGMIYPEDVDLIVCIDAFKPMVRKANNVHMANAIENFLKYNDFALETKEPPSYTIEQIKHKVAAPNRNSVNLEFTHILMERNIAPSKHHPGKYYFTRDPRLKVGGLVNFPQDETLEYSQYIKFPICIIKARQASYYEHRSNFYEVLDVLKRSSVDCNFQYIEGTHHVHLNSPESVSNLIGSFIRRHNIEDRTVQTIDKKMIFSG